MFSLVNDKFFRDANAMNRQEQKLSKNKRRLSFSSYLLGNLWSMGVGTFQNIRNKDFVPNSSVSACSKYQFVLVKRGGGLTKVVSAVAVSECPLEAAGPAQPLHLSLSLHRHVWPQLLGEAGQRPQVSAHTCTRVLCGDPVRSSRDIGTWHIHMLVPIAGSYGYL